MPEKTEKKDTAKQQKPETKDAGAEAQESQQVGAEKKPETKETAKSQKDEASTQTKSAAEEEQVAEATAATSIGDISYYSGIRDDLPEIKPGDVIRVFYRVIEGGKERTQIFEGIAIAIKNKGISKTIHVRKTSFGIAVERIFPLNSKLIQKIEIKKHSKVRRAKLYYLRNLRGKAARLKELR